MIYESIIRREDDNAYLIARMVWATANGWKRPEKQAKKDLEKDLEKFKGLGTLEEK